MNVATALSGPDRWTDVMRVATIRSQNSERPTVGFVSARFLATRTRTKGFASCKATNALT